MNTDTTKKVQAAEVTFADDAFSPLPEGALDQDQIARKKTTYFCALASQCFALT